MGVPLNWWQAVFFWPGITFMDWLARTYPYVVIRYGFGFTMESYVFWSAVISVLFWMLLMGLATLLFVRVRKRAAAR